VPGDELLDFAKIPISSRYEETYPDHQYYGYDPACSYYGTCPDYGYGSRPNPRQSWYYCSNPAGYYPYVAHCKDGWRAVPAS
jgi:hypothetical protein